MIVSRGYTFAELNGRAEAAEAPKQIITADCSDPREIDDGVFVEPLPAAHETYRVGVCVADTSGLYSDGDIFRQVLKNTEARYWRLPNGEQAYDPMIESDAIKRLELTAGMVRSAMIISFIVGERQAPDQVDVSFQDVEIIGNLTYKKFGDKSRYDHEFRRFGRASAFILRHLQFNPGGDDERKSRFDVEDPEEAYRALMHVSSRESWGRGSKLNEAYMVAANHLVGKAMRDEDRPAIYRVHDTSDESFLEVMPANVARFSLTPGYHEGLNLDPYCRVTSPLRRLEDYMMNNQLKKYSLGLPVTRKDHQDLAAAVQRLNQQVITDVGRGPLRLSAHDTLGGKQWPGLRLVGPDSAIA